MDIAMKRLLTTEIRKSYRQRYASDPLLTVVDKAYKGMEREMDSLRFSPEEIWLNCFCELDRLAMRPEGALKKAGTLWDSLFCDLRGEAEETDRRFVREELETATSCILYVLAVCLMATDLPELKACVPTLFAQISAHSDFHAISSPLAATLCGGVKAGTECREIMENVQTYLRRKRYISLELENAEDRDSNILPKVSRLNRSEAAGRVKKRLAFMSGATKKEKIPIMKAEDFRRMMEAVEYLIDNGSVQRLEAGIPTRMPLNHLRYTFYLVWEKDARFIARNLWIDFLTATFSQFQNQTADSLYRSFSKKPADYPDADDKGKAKIEKNNFR